MDYILWNLGLGHSEMNAPQKLAVLSKVGASSVSVLQRLIRQRNLLEHKYESADLTSATDAVDIAELFIHTTAPISNRRYGYIDFWSAAGKVGGELQFHFGDKDENTRYDVPWLLEHGMPVDVSPTSVEYAIFVSHRADNENPRELFDTWECHNSLPALEREKKHPEFGLQYVGKGMIFPVCDELYCALVRIMVLAMRYWM
jgi:hypothetical protein